jgi:hypothetical protein
MDRAYAATRAASFKRLLDGVSWMVRPLDIVYQFRELRLRELVPTPIQGSHDGLWQCPPVLLEMLEWYLRVIPAVVKVKGRYVTQASSKITRQREFREVCTPEGGRDQKESRH